MQTTTRPARSPETVRWVRADEVRVRDVVRIDTFDGGTEDVVVTSTAWVGDDVQFVGVVEVTSSRSRTFVERRWETSEGNGCFVVGRR